MSFVDNAEWMRKVAKFGPLYVQLCGNGCGRSVECSGIIICESGHRLRGVKICQECYEIEAAAPRSLS